MDWLEITVRTNSAGADMISDVLMRAGAAGTVVEDRHDLEQNLEGPAKWDLIDPSLIANMDADVLVRAYLAAENAAPERIDALRRTLSALTPEAVGFDAGARTLAMQNVREEDWAENWKQYYKPFRVGETLVICPVWETYDARPGDRVIEIDPGMAFGNGTHETTNMCLEALEGLVRPGDDVLDVGTGSGILAMAAGRLGARRALGIDLDPVAVRVAAENVARNGLGDTVTVRVGDLLAGVDFQADLVCANIIADVIILLSGAVSRCMKPGAAFLSSGIIRDREDDVRAALASAGFAVDACWHRGEWVALLARRG